MLHEGAVVLGADDETVNRLRIEVDPIGLGNGQTGTVVYSGSRVGVEDEGTTVIGHEQPTIG